MRIDPGRRGTASGATLLEMLITIAVLLILTSVAVPAARFAIKRRRSSTCAAPFATCGPRSTSTRSTATPG